MLTWMDAHEGNSRPLTDDAAIRSRLIREGSVRTKEFDPVDVSASIKATLASIKTYMEKCRRVIENRSVYEYRSMLENMLRASQPEAVKPPEGPGAVIARALGIKSLVIDLSASMVSRAKGALASPTVKSIGFYSGLKLDGRNAP